MLLTREQRILIALKRGPDNWLWWKFGVGKERKINIIKEYQRIYQQSCRSFDFSRVQFPHPFFAGDFLRKWGWKIGLGFLFAVMIYFVLSPIFTWVFLMD